MRRTRWLLLALALSACVPMQPARVPVPTPTPITEPDETQQVIELLGYYQRVGQMNAEEQRRELNMATQTFNRERSSYNRARLALLHLLPGTGFQDDAKAVQLLEPLASGGGPVQKLAGLLYGQIGERVKAQKRADQMKDQLEALRAIERSMIERGQQSQPRKPGT